MPLVVVGVANVLVWVDAAAVFPNGGTSDRCLSQPVGGRERGKEKENRERGGKKKSANYEQAAQHNHTRVAWTQTTLCWGAATGYVLRGGSVAGEKMARRRKGK